jgi:hypothetical protein
LLELLLLLTILSIELSLSIRFKSPRDRKTLTYKGMGRTMGLKDMVIERVESLMISRVSNSLKSIL